ncbi:phosphate acyltransferase PlsX [Asanoa sp. WMMD1127]|uniref:phosphate acyltransferase PlsX n=1 Tax=Asanoa sp. WMMD1127 TaxID=3016107 RepID=UPI0024176473|nr:phosphate acyltransferase PlsX [Asanoa sp. WMMD1127]MDG4823543.1 phosphate acyltransferase PlsX [Asanoa sp. WMMD1127]
MEPGAVRIAVDLLGGDEAPAVVVDGALRALTADPDLRLLLVGPAPVAGEVIGALPPADRDRVSVRPLWGHVGMADPPQRGGRSDTTVRGAALAVAEGAADALVSAGATGAIVTAAVLSLGRWPGIRRPALVATIPAIAGPVALLDVGGSLEARPVTLAGHALLGAAYAGIVHDVARPRVGLLSVGTETGKGDRVRRTTDPMLADLKLGGDAHYVGLVEGYDISSGERADVVVTDGFTGNTLLKGIEGAYAMAGGPPPGGAAPRAAALLGVAGTVVVCHGGATGDDIASGLALAANLHRINAITRIATALADLIEVTT